MSLDAQTPGLPQAISGGVELPSARSMATLAGQRSPQNESVAGISPENSGAYDGMSEVSQSSDGGDGSVLTLDGVDTELNVDQASIAQAPAEGVTTPRSVDRLDGPDVIAKSDIRRRMPRPALRLKPLVREASPTSIYVHAFVSPLDANQVITRRLPVFEYDITADNRLTQGSSAGLLFDIMQGRLGIQLGAVYSRINYRPSALKFYLAEELPLVEASAGYSRFRYEQIEFPFSVNAVIAENDRWRWSARATMSVAVTATSTFDITEVDREAIAAYNQQVNNGQITLPELNTPTGRSTDAEASLELIDPDAGWLENGGFFNNTNFYLGGGFMLERLLGGRSSVYINPSFGRVIYLNPDEEAAGTGPYQDRIHIGQLRLGARYRLSRK